MNPWLDFILIVALSLAIFRVAYADQKRRWLWIGIGGAAIAVAVVLCEALRGREYALLMSAAVPMLAAPIIRLPMSRRTRIGLMILTTGSVGYAGWFEFLAPALSRAELATLKTQFHGGVCIQSTSYTCGPAAAVTLLRRKGFTAEEGDLGRLSKCSEHTGTDGPLLADAINTRFADSGIECEAVKFTDINALMAAGEVLTTVNLDPWTDHWVVVLSITNKTVETADPIAGLHVEPRAQFERRWRRDGVLIKRRQIDSGPR